MAAALTVLIALAVVQFVYFRVLVHRAPSPPGGPLGGGGPAPVPPAALGRRDVTVETLAGDTPGYRDGPAWQAQFSGPNALALDADGNLYVADSRNHRIRRVSPQGRTETVAGSGNDSGAALEGPALEVGLRYPSGVAVATDGSVLIADTGHHRLCRLQDGKVTTVAGGQRGWADGKGAAARFNLPATLQWGTDGALWVLDAGNRRLRRLSGDGTVTTPVQPPARISRLMGDAVGAGPHPRLMASPNGEGSPVPVNYRLGKASPGAETPSGLRLFADLSYHVILASQGDSPPLVLASRRQVGRISVGSRDDDGTRATFARPCAIVIANDRIAYVADYEGNRIRRLRLPPWLAAGQPVPRLRVGRFER